MLALGLGAGLAILLFGSGPSLATTVPTAPFWHKIACSLAVAAGGFLLARSLARPDGSGRSVVALVPAAVLLALGAVTDESGFPVLGRSGQSVPICLAAIVLLSLPAASCWCAAWPGRTARAARSWHWCLGPHCWRSAP